MLDAIVIGGGHNGLAAAAYLARAGLKTAVLERRELVGGACVTEELWPGFRVSRAAYVVGLLRPELLRELGLTARGLRLLARNPSSFTPIRGERGLLLGPDREACHGEIRRFSQRDAGRFGDYESMLDRAAAAIEPLLDVPPPDPARLHLRDIPPLLRLLRGAISLRRELPRVLALLLGPARSTLESWFESEPLRATLATDAIIGAWASPSTPGTGYVLFHHVMGETHGARGVWAYVEGGMGRLSELLAEAAREAGAEIRTGASVASVIVDREGARGVTLEDGSVIEARAVVSSADPHRTFIDLMDPEHLPAELLRGIQSLDFRSPVAKINLALDRLPGFAGRSGNVPGPEHVGTIHIGASTLDDLDRSFEAACRGEIPERPMVELTLPSALDCSLAPEGKHLGSMFVQHVPYRLAGSSWDVERDRLADRVFDLVDEVAPGFSESVLHREVLPPPDLERIFALRGGNIFHGAMSLDRLGFMRPLPSCARYRTPIRNLYLCGAGTHPGGGVMGACGRNAAGEVLRELRPHSRRR
jgi:phytoene dehydrogenase-like protein